MDQSDKDEMTIKVASEADKAEWLRLRMALWPDVSKEIHEREMDAMCSDSERFAVFVVPGPNDRLLGFLEVSIREIIDEGCIFKHIGYIEGWYVEPDWRRKGIGGELVKAAEEWASGKGVTEMGSDTGIEDIVSQKAHQALGYQEQDRLILYRKAFGDARR